MGYKLVRDKHKERLGDVVSGTWRTSPDPVSALTKKIGEEYGEFTENYNPDELYDMLDVLDELVSLLDPDGKYLTGHVEKIAQLGNFNTHLEWHPIPGAKEWKDL